jgi:hypothetical protein
MRIDSDITVSDGNDDGTEKHDEAHDVIRKTDRRLRHEGRHECTQGGCHDENGILLVLV